MCDIDNLRNDKTNHPFFTERLRKWKNGPDGANGCIPSNASAKTLKSTDCLTDEEIACYSNYMLEKKREKLDSSLSEIYQPESAPSSSFDSNYQTTMLTGVVWAMLGTTVLYYAFTKI